MTKNAAADRWSTLRQGFKRGHPYGEKFKVEEEGEAGKFPLYASGGSIGNNDDVHPVCDVSIV